MLTQSDEFNNAFASDQRTLAIKMSVNDEDIYTNADIVSLDYDSAAYTGDSFGIGSTYENSIKVTFVDLVESIKQNDIVKPQIGIQLPDGTFEYAPLGVFVISDQIEQDRNAEQTSFTAVDSMCYLEGTYIPKDDSTMQSVQSIALDIANQAGVIINQDNFNRLPSDKVISPITGQTYRNALGMLAQFLAGYVVFNRYGELELRTLSRYVYNISPKNYEFGGLTKSETLYSLMGISAEVVKTTGSGDTEESSTTTLHTGETSGSQITVSNSSMTQVLLDGILDKLNGLSFYPYTLNWFGNPAVEAGDWLLVSDTKGNIYKVPNNSFQLTFDGGLSAVSQTNETATSSSIYSYRGSLSQTITEIVGHVGASGNYVYTGIGTPVSPKYNDLWYKPVDGLVEMYIYNGTEWVLTASDVTGDNIKKQVDDAQKSLEEEVANVNKQIDNMNDSINLKVSSKDLISQINIEAGHTLIQSEKIYLDATSVIFGGEAFIPSAVITNLSADKITAGTINGDLINVINLNAANITTGTINGKDLAINLDTGSVVFQSGQLHSADDSIDINIDQKYMSVADGNSRVLLKGGELQFVEPSIFDLESNPYFSIRNSVTGISFSGASLSGRDFIALYNGVNPPTSFNIMGQEKFAGIYTGKANGTWNATKVGGAERGLILSAGHQMSSKVSTLTNSPYIIVGSDGKSGVKGNRTEIWGDYVHIPPVYFRTGSTSANIYVASDGAILRSTSASKYKINIETMNDTNQAHALLSINAKTWYDKAETEMVANELTDGSDIVGSPRVQPYLGFIAEDFANAGLETLVVRGTNNQLEGINYDRISALEHLNVQELFKRVLELENQVYQLRRDLDES